MADTIYDYIIIGSGFGGSVSAMRLSEKGYSVLVLEKGRRFTAKDFPKTNWNLRKYLWAPALKFFGIQKLTFFKEVFVISGVGVGGGSLVYANTHMVPDDKFFSNPSWARFNDWKKVLAPYYQRAKFMLGSVPYPRLNEEDLALREVARDMGKEDSFGNVAVGVYFGDTSKEYDPYFNGLGPNRRGCTECAGCMVGCRHNAKNTLDKNYLWFAEKFGAKVQAETLVTKIEYKDDTYHITTQSSTSWFNRDVKVYKSKGLVVSGGVLGTMHLLLKQKYETGTLPNLSDTLGFTVRTNSESLCGVVSRDDRKLNNGIAITSIFNADEHTHIEIVKFPDYSDSMFRLATFATGPGTPLTRTAKLIGNILSKPFAYLKANFKLNIARNAIIILVMQTLDNSMKMVWKKGLFGGSIALDNSGQNRVPAYIPKGQEVMHRYAGKVNGIAMNAFTEILFNMSTTAHILGGCPMGETAKEGVIDAQFRAHGYPNMYILDGSIIQGNLGVNPSLTITALSEYAMEQIPVKEGSKVQPLEVLMREQANLA